jgi:S1-C subfamily serine protease
VKKALKTMALSVLFLGLTVAAHPVPSRMTIPAIAKDAHGAVVSIIISGKDGNPIAQGSGFLISKDGLILTNYHVIESGSSAIVKLPDGAFFVVDGLMAFDKARDVAIIKAHGEDFRTLRLGNSDQLQVGEEVVAIGNPLSLESTVSNGIISGIRTVEEQGGKLLQVTTPISPGSSGGPLFNMAGEVVGITTLYLKGGENLNFAIPINGAKRLLLAKSSKVQALPNETEPVKAQTQDADAPAQQGTQQNVTKPLTKDEVLSLLSSGVSVEQVTSLVKQRGVDFAPVDSYVEQILKVLNFPLTDEDVKDAASARAANQRVIMTSALIAAMGEALKIDEVNCAEYEEWRGRYQWGDGCPLWNEMIRSNNKSVIGVLKAARETYIMFPSPNVFVMVAFTLLDPTRFSLGRYTSEGGVQPHGWQVEHRITEYSSHDDSSLLWRSDGKPEGFREVVVTPDELKYSLAHGGFDPYWKEVISRSTGRYSQWYPSSPTPHHYGKAAVYHFGVLQK